MTVVPAIQKPRQENCDELQAILGYTVSTSPVRATWQDPLSPKPFLFGVPLEALLSDTLEGVLSFLNPRFIRLTQRQSCLEGPSHHRAFLYL